MSSHWMSGYSPEAVVDVAQASPPPSRGIPVRLRRGLASPLPVVLGAAGGLGSAVAAFRDKPLAYLMLGFAGVLVGYAVYFVASSYERLLNVRALAQTALEEGASRDDLAKALSHAAEAASRLEEKERRSDEPSARRDEQDGERDD
jgi:hypothetical protein